MKKNILILLILTAFSSSLRAQTAQQPTAAPAAKKQPFGMVQTSDAIEKKVSNKKHGPQFMIIPIKPGSKKPSARNKITALKETGIQKDSTAAMGIPGEIVPVPELTENE